MADLIQQQSDKLNQKKSVESSQSVYEQSPIGPETFTNPRANPKTIMQLQRTIGNRATVSLIQASPNSHRQPAIQRKPQNLIQRNGDDDENESLLSSDAKDNAAMEMIDLGPEPEDDKKADVKNDPKADADAFARGQELADILPLLTDAIGSAKGLDEKLAAYLDKKSDFDLLGELEAISQMIIEGVGRQDVKTMADLSETLTNPFFVTAKDIANTERTLRAAARRVANLSGGAIYVVQKLQKKGMKSNIKKMQDDLDPKAALAGKIGGKFTDVTTSILGSLVTLFTSPFITPLGGAALGMGVKKGAQKGLKYAAKTLYEDHLVDEQMEMDDAEQFQPLMGNADKKKGRIKKGVDNVKSYASHYADSDNAKKEAKKSSAKEMVSQGLEYGAEAASLFDGGISSAIVSGVTSFGLSEASDKAFGKSEVETNDVAYQLNYSELQQFGEKLDQFMTAVEALG